MDGDALTFVIETPPSHGSAVVNGAIIGYTPAANFCGEDSFAYRASDGKGGSGEASVSVAVACVNDAPVAGHGSAVVAEGSTIAIDMLPFASDADGDALTFAIETPPSHGDVAADGMRVHYTPAVGFSGNDSFAYTAGDGQTNSNVGTVSISVVSNAAALSELSINPTSVRGGRSSTGTVLLSAPAPPGGVNVTLTDNSAYVSTPGSVAVPEGATAATFSISTRYVFWATTAAITASCNGAQRKAQLRVTR